MGVWGSDAYRLVNSSPEKVDSLNIVLSAYRSVRSPVAYVSMPITTGVLFYEVLERHGVRTLEELLAKDKDALVREIIKPNIAAGVKFADDLQTRLGLPVVAPGIFEAKKQRWSQDEYQFLWSRVIEECALQLHMTDGWQYSNGCSEEFVRAIEMQFGFVNPLCGMEYVPKEDAMRIGQQMRKIKIYDARGEEMRIDQGCVMIADAVGDLARRGFDPKGIFAPLNKLVSIGEFLFDPQLLYHGVAFIQQPYEYDFAAMHKACTRLELEFPGRVVPMEKARFDNALWYYGEVQKRGPEIVDGKFSERWADRSE